MFIFEEQKYWLLLLCLLVVLLVFAVYMLWRKKTQKRFAVAGMLANLSPNTSIFKPILKVTLLSLAITCFVVALVNPKTGFGDSTMRFESEGVDVVFAIDVSKSMLAEDAQPNRLMLSQQIVERLINSMAGNRVGLIAYAGSAVPQLPITTDYAAAKMFLQSMNTDMVSSQGTAIGDAIQLANNYYGEENEVGKVLIIISDGEDHEGDYLEAVEQARQQGIVVYTIGVGTEKGGVIPIKRNGITLNYKRDKDGEVVITALNEVNLHEIAEEGGGEYIHATSATAVVENLNEIFQGLDKTKFQSAQTSGLNDLFQWFLALGLLLVFMEVFLLERKTKWIKQLNLFNEEKKA